MACDGQFALLSHSAAYFLRKELGASATIDVFESQPRAGGRLLEFHYLNETYEAGGSIVFSGNRYMSDLATEMRLTKVEPPKLEGGGTGLWDGEQLTHITGSKLKVPIALHVAYRACAPP